MWVNNIIYYVLPVKFLQICSQIEPRGLSVLLLNSSNGMRCMSTSQTKTEAGSRQREERPMWASDTYRLFPQRPAKHKRAVYVRSCGSDSQTAGMQRGDVSSSWISATATLPITAFNWLAAKKATSTRRAGSSSHAVVNQMQINYTSSVFSRCSKLSLVNIIA